MAQQQRKGQSWVAEWVYLELVADLRDLSAKLTKHPIPQIGPVGIAKRIDDILAKANRNLYVEPDEKTTQKGANG